MQKIIPHLWFDTQAKEAAELYVSAFLRIGQESAITDVTTLKDTPSGDADTVTFTLGSHDFMAISAGPYFTLNPSISFMVNFDPSRDPEADAHLEQLWNALSEGGKAMMPLQEYPFSKKYGWTEDKYGVSWQFMLTNPDGEPRPFIMPSLLFTGDVYAKAEEAGNFYLSVFKDAKRGTVARYPAGMEPDKEGAIMFSDFQLEGEWFTAMDSAPKHGHAFAFNEAVSFIVHCGSQDEVDYYWEKLSAHPENEQCGWVKDHFGVSWQIVPMRMHEMLRDGTPAQVERVTQAFLPMKKLDIATLERAYAGN